MNLKNNTFRMPVGDFSQQAGTGSKMFARQMAILTSLIAISAIGECLYFLPFIGDIFKQSQYFYYGSSPLIAILFCISLIYDRKISRNQLYTTVWLLFVFMALYQFSPLRMMQVSGLLAIVMLKDEQRRVAFEKFKTLFCAILFINIIAYPFIVMDWLPRFAEIVPDHWLKQEVGMFYENFGISYELKSSYSLRQTGELFRMSAWFEEPGNVGTLAGLILAATGFKMDRKGWVLLVGGLLSFSLAFYLMVAIYLGMKKPKIFLLVSAALILVLTLFQDNEFVTKTLTDRLSFSESKVSGDNRTEEIFDVAFDNFLDTPNVWLGQDADHQLNKLQFNTSSWKNLVWDYGIIGTFLYLSIFIFLAIQSVLKNPVNRYRQILDLAPFVIVFFLSIYQRPYVVSLSYFLIFMGAMTMANKGSGTSNE